MEKYYEQYSDNIAYMENIINYFKDLSNQIYSYNEDCYNEYKDEEYVDMGKYDEYSKAYSEYKEQYSRYYDEYMKYKQMRDYASMQDIFRKVNELNRNFYEKSMNVYYMFKNMYDKGNYEKGSKLYYYMHYMELYRYYQQTYYENYYSRYSVVDNQYYYGVSLLKTQDILTYPHMEIDYNEKEMKKIEYNYKQHKVVLPIIVTSKIGDDGKPYYHILDGYYMYSTLKKAGIQYIPAIVYNGLPEKIEQSYMKNPYMGNNYK